MENQRFCITKLTPDYRIMLYPHNQRGTYETEREARDHLVCMIANNNDSAIHDLLGDVEQVTIEPVNCYTGGDPRQTIFGSGRNEN